MMELAAAEELRMRSAEEFEFEFGFEGLVKGFEEELV